MPPRDVIIFAGALFDSPLWTNRQQIASRLAKRGWRVLYVEPRFFLLAPLFGRLRSTGGALRWFWRHIVPATPSANLHVIAQNNVLPGSRRYGWIGRINHALNAWRIRVCAWLLGFECPVLLIYDTEAAAFLRTFLESRVVYDCVDDHRVQAGVERSAVRVEREEHIIAERADAIAVTAEPLFERFRAAGRTVHLVPNAADVSAFLQAPKKEPADIASIPHPRIGTVGALDTYKIDINLLLSVATAHPTWHLVLVGPVDYAGVGGGKDTASVEQLRRLPNVHFLGRKDHAQVPAYVHAFDVAIIPYRESPYNRSSFPLKFWEFLAAGKPVVASGLPSLRQYAQFVFLADTPAAFSDAIQTTLKEDTRLSACRQEEARKHDWTSRVDAVEQLLIDQQR